LYDLFYADKPYEQEAAFVHRCLESSGGSNSRHILELACGTGSHAFALEKLGYEIIATDHSEDMLASALRKAAALRSNIVFRQQDMRSLQIPERPFDAAICLFDSIGYVATNKALKEVLTGVHQHLRPGGIFLFEFWHAAAMLTSYEPIRIRRYQTPNGHILRISETLLDHARQLACVTYTVYEHFDDGTYRCFQEVQTNRYFSLQEVEVLLSSAGFNLIKSYSGFSKDEMITDKTWHVIAVARLIE
jgi:SAM-dependent methyltransferase